MNKKTFLAGLAVSALAASSAMALSSTKQASVTLVAPLTLTGTDLNFGLVEKPGAGLTQTVIVDKDGGFGTSTAIIANSAAIAAGDYTIAADNGAQVAITIAGGTATGLTLGAFVMAYNSSPYTSGTAVNAVSGGAALEVGATLTITDLVVVGVNTVPYTITVNYQ
jgi:hypothetical protein